MNVASVIITKVFFESIISSVAINCSREILGSGLAQTYRLTNVELWITFDISSGRVNV